MSGEWVSQTEYIERYAKAKGMGRAAAKTQVIRFIDKLTHIRKGTHHPREGEYVWPSRVRVAVWDDGSYPTLLDKRVRKEPEYDQPIYCACGRRIVAWEEYDQCSQCRHSSAGFSPAVRAALEHHWREIRSRFIVDRNDPERWAERVARVEAHRERVERELKELEDAA